MIDNRLVKDILRAACDGVTTGLATVLCYALIALFSWMMRGVVSPSNPPQPQPVRIAAPRRIR